jgi:hypothetical protein
VAVSRKRRGSKGRSFAPQWIQEHKAHDNPLRERTRHRVATERACAATARPGAQGTENEMAGEKESELNSQYTA